MHTGRDGIPLLLSQFPTAGTAVSALLPKASAGQPAALGHANASVQSLVAQIKLQQERAELSYWTLC